MKTEFIDLALPSGTLWAANDREERLTASRAKDRNIPTRRDFEELLANCKAEDIPGGIRLTGANGNSIELHRSGYDVPVYDLDAKEPSDPAEAKEYREREREYSRVDDGVGYYRTRNDGAVLFLHPDGRMEFRLSENSYRFSARLIQKPIDQA